MHLMSSRLRDVKPTISGLELHLKWPQSIASSPHQLTDVFKQHVSQSYTKSEVLATQVTVYLSMYEYMCPTSVRLK